MFAPDDPLAPPKASFAEPWQASTLAIAAALIREKRVSPTEWAEALGAALREAERTGAPDTDETYFAAALIALERVSAASGVSNEAQVERRAAWEKAYRQTPHGEPVRLDRSKPA